MATAVNYLIAPKEICQACSYPSGQTYSLRQFQHPSESPIHRSQQPLTGIRRRSKVSEIGDVELEIKQLDQEIERISGSLNKFKARREELKRHVNNERCLLSPIRSLSEDLLGYIFIMAQEGVCEAVLNIEEVCVHWRAVAQSTPRLWSTVVLNSDGSEEVSELLSVLYKCIRLSREAPITIKFKPYEYISFPSSEDLGSTCIQALAGCAHRWDVVVNISMELLRTVLDLLPEGSSLPMLSRLWITRIEGSVVVPPAPNLTELSVDELEDDEENISISFQSIPSLKTFRLADLKHPLDVFSGIPWGEITYFKSDRVEYQAEELSNILKSMTKLGSLKFFGDSGTSSTSRIVLPHVHFFSMKHLRGSSNALDIFILPSLTTLCPSKRSKPESIIQFLQRSGCKLETLQLTGDLNEQWRARELQSIRRLTYCPPDKGDMWDLKPLIRTDSAKSTAQEAVEFDVLPNLEVLEIQEFKLRRFTPVKDLISIVTSRLGAPAAKGQTSADKVLVCLRKVTVNFADVSREEYVKRWIEFCQSETAQASGVVWKIVYGGTTFNY